MADETEKTAATMIEDAEQTKEPTQPMEIDPEVNRKLLRKIDFYLMPVLCFTYCLQFYDKALLSQAAIFGLREDLGILTGLRYSWVSLIFYFGYLAGCYPSSWLAQRYSSHRMCSIICILWSFVVICTPACTNYAGFLVNRFILGVIESGVSPMFMLVVGLWYTKAEQAYRSGWWYSFSGGTLLVSPLINYGLGHITGGSLAPWQYMYLIAGIFTLFWGIALWWIFPRSPQDAKGFTEEERILLLERTRMNNAGMENNKFKMYQFKEALLAYQFWGIFFLSILSSMGSGVLTTFGAIIFNGMGFTTFESLLLNMPNGAMAFICILGSGYLSRKLPNSQLHIVTLACAPVIVGACLVWQLSEAARPGRIVGFYLINFFSSAWVQCIGLGTSNVAGYSKKATYAAGTFIGYSIGNIIGPLMFDAKYAPRYNNSFMGTLICYVACAIISQLLRFSMARENKRRDRKYGVPSVEHGLDDLTDKENKSFRYNL